MKKSTLKLLSLVLIILMLMTSGCKKTPTDDPNTSGTPGANGDATGNTNTVGAPAGTYVPIPLKYDEDGDENEGKTCVEVTPPANEDDHTVNSLLPPISATFEGAETVKETNWYGLNGNVKLSLSEEGFVGQCLRFDKDPDVNFHTALVDIAPYITHGGVYTIRFKIRVVGGDGATNAFQGVVRCGKPTSFTGTKDYKGTGAAAPMDDEIWYMYTGQLTVADEDIGKGGKWGLGLQTIQTGIETVFIDDVEVFEAAYEEEPKAVTEAVTWVANEVVLNSSKEYKDPVMDVDVDLILTDGNVTYTVPGFWDGGNVWRVRFMCPTAGTWTYTTKCTDTSDTGLHGQTSTVECKAYTGNLNIYKHGFIKTEPNVKYFMYNDGTPFFYLGDTHWALGNETIDMVKSIVKDRARQGYTVYQSEPIGATYNFIDGISSSDIKGLKSYDQKFKEIAAYGLVHTNASLFFTSSMPEFIEANGGYSDKEVGVGVHKNGTIIKFRDLADSTKLMLEKMCRYWVARYSAYPVMWTLAQEADNDFFWTELNDFHGHEQWGLANNPFKYVAEYIHKYDPYNAPLTAHQEGSSYTKASNSAFRDVAGHTWYASQWKPDITGKKLVSTNAMDYWQYGQGKPCVNYESHYCFLETQHFGARAQGWMSFLSGFCGYGYGAQDTWYYLGNYNENEPTDDGVDIITVDEKKAANWKDAVKYESSIQAASMRTFFENSVGDWYNLIPRFDDTAYLERENGAYAVIASNESNTKIVTYFYNFSDATVGEKVNSSAGGAKTGTFGNLEANGTYNYMWFDPIKGKIAGTGTFTADANGRWHAGEKALTDMVLYIYK